MNPAWWWQTFPLIAISIFFINSAVGYTKPGLKGYNFEEATKMDDYVESNGKYEKTGTIKGVTFKYKRDAEISTIKIAGKNKIW